jgi:hypothetical protein
MATASATDSVTVLFQPLLGLLPFRFARLVSPILFLLVILV